MNKLVFLFLLIASVQFIGIFADDLQTADESQGPDSEETSNLDQETPDSDNANVGEEPNGADNQAEVNEPELPIQNGQENELVDDSESTGDLDQQIPDSDNANVGEEPNGANDDAQVVEPPKPIGPVHEGKDEEDNQEVVTLVDLTLDEPETQTAGESNEPELSTLKPSEDANKFDSIRKWRVNLNFRVMNVKLLTEKQKKETSILNVITTVKLNSRIGRLNKLTLEIQNDTKFDAMNEKDAMKSLLTFESNLISEADGKYNHAIGQCSYNEVVFRCLQQKN